MSIRWAVVGLWAIVMRRREAPAPLLGVAGVSFGAALVGPVPLVSVPAGDEGLRLAPADLVMVDVDGALWRIVTGKRFRLIRWALERRVYVFPSLGALVAALQRGDVVGLVPAVAPLAGVPWEACNG